MSWSDAPFELDVVLEAARQVRPLPRTATALVAECMDDRADLRRMAEIVEGDRATATLVRTSAWAALGPEREAVNVREAVVLLGAGNVLAMVLAAHLRELMVSPVPSYDLRRGELWGHAVMAAAAADCIGLAAGVVVPPVAGATALLHDIGKLVLGPHLRPAQQRALRTADPEGRVERTRRERLVLGVDSDFLGSTIVLSWGLPRSVADAIAHTHDPAGRPALAHVTSLANRAAHHIGRARGTDQGGLGESMAALRLDLRDWPELLRQAERRVQQMAARHHALAVPERQGDRGAR